MGGGASKARVEQLQQENENLKAQLRELRQEGSRKSLTASASSKRDAQRRGEISAEAVAEKINSYERVFFPKDDSVREILQETVENNLLFMTLRVEEKNECVDAFQRVKFKAGTQIIRQGDDGNEFYVIEEEK